MIPYLTIPIGLSIQNLHSLWSIIILFVILSFIMVVSRMIILTVSFEEFKKIDPDLLTRIKKRKIGIIELIRPKYILKLIPLVFKGLFIRKIRFEKSNRLKRFAD